MPITWNSEAEAKLLLGILDQFKGSTLRLDYNALATYMGPGCSVPAVKQHIAKLRREVNGSSGDGPSTPTGTPKKSKRADAPQTPSKKAKAIHRDKDDDYPVDELDVKQEIKIKNEDEKKMDISFVTLDA